MPATQNSALSAMEEGTRLEIAPKLELESARCAARSAISRLGALKCGH
jgi:hypothetical protein